MYSYSQETSTVDDSILIIQSWGSLGTVILTLSIFHTTYEISSCVREHPRRFCYIQTRIVINLRLNIVLTALTAFSKSKPNSTLNPFSTRGMCSREVKNKSCQCDLSAKKIRREKEFTCKIERDTTKIKIFII